MHSAYALTGVRDVAMPVLVLDTLSAMPLSSAAAGKCGGDLRDSPSNGDSPSNSFPTDFPIGLLTRAHSTLTKATRAICDFAQV